MKKVLLLLIISAYSLSLFSQESSLYVGYKSMRELNVSYDYSLEYNKTVGFTIGYVFANDYERPYGNIFDNLPATLTRKQNQQGLSLSSFVRYRTGNRRRLLLGLSLEYQYLQSGNYTYHSTSNSGSSLNYNSGDYSEFKQYYNNFSLLFGIHHEFLEHNIADVYFESGLTYKSIERIYSIEGYYTSQWESSRIEYIGNLTPTFRIGIIFRIISFGEKMEDPFLKKGTKDGIVPNVRML